MRSEASLAPEGAASCRILSGERVSFASWHAPCAAGPIRLARFQLIASTVSFKHAAVGVSHARQPRARARPSCPGRCRCRPASAIKTCEELGGFRRCAAAPQFAGRAGCGDEHQRTPGQDLRPCSPFTSERFPGCRRNFPDFYGALLRSVADGGRRRRTRRGADRGCRLSSERVSREQSAYSSVFP